MLLCGCRTPPSRCHCRCILYSSYDDESSTCQRSFLGELSLRLLLRKQSTATTAAGVAILLQNRVVAFSVPSMKIVDIAKAIAPEAKINVIGIRPGEKIHEQMIGLEDAPHTIEYQNYYKILPTLHGWSNDKLRIGNGIIS